MKNAEIKAYHTSKDVEIIIVAVLERVSTKEATWQEVISS
jgi:hypothetical protein